MEDPEFTAFIKGIGMKYAKMIRTNADRLPSGLVVGMAGTIEVYCDSLDGQKKRLDKLQERVDAYCRDIEEDEASIRKAEEAKKRKSRLRPVK